jgi:1-aminocyclopropane-1-carboxylate deaminase
MLKLYLNDCTTELLQLPALADKAVQLAVLRLDKIHPVISGNKWFKLRFYLEEALQQEKKTIVTFGGAYSNHIVATALACQLTGFSSVGIIRGERPVLLSHTLEAAQGYGMQLYFQNRRDYREKKFPADYDSATADTYIIPEGGYGKKGADGAATIMDYCKQQAFTHICCAAGSGTTMAGLVKAATHQQQVLGISVLKNNFALFDEIKNLLTDSEKEKNFRLLQDYHFGGYAKYTAALITFMNNFFLSTGLPTDFVYTGKLFYAILDMLQKDFFPPGSKILVIHSGGLQGNQSLPAGMLAF